MVSSPPHAAPREKNIWPHASAQTCNQIWYMINHIIDNSYHIHHICNHTWYMINHIIGNIYPIQFITKHDKVNRHILPIFLLLHVFWVFLCVGALGLGSLGTRVWEHFMWVWGLGLVFSRAIAYGNLSKMGIQQLMFKITMSMIWMYKCQWYHWPAARDRNVTD